MKALDDVDQAVSVGALDMLTEMGKIAVPDLTKALGNEKTAGMACLAVSELGPDAEPAVPALRRLLEHTHNGKLRREAILSLGAIGPASAPAVPALVQALADGDLQMRITAAYALGRIGPAAEAATGLLKRYLEDDQKVFLRTLCSWALARIHPNDKAATRRAIPMLLEAMAMPSRDPLLHPMAGRALADLHADPAILLPPLLKLLDHAKPDTAVEIVGVLSTQGEAAVPGLIKALDFKELRPRVIAVLAGLGPAAKPAVPALAEVVGEGRSDGRTRRADGPGGHWSGGCRRPSRPPSRRSTTPIRTSATALVMPWGRLARRPWPPRRPCSRCWPRTIRFFPWSARGAWPTSTRIVETFRRASVPQLIQRWRTPIP